MNELNFPRPPFFIGFDNMFNELERINSRNDSGYPPYNITKVNDEKTVIEIAVAGFSLPDLSIEEKDGTLSITGSQASSRDVEYAHKGISSRKFKRDFRLAEFTRVDKADLIDGILYVQLLRELPDEKKPRLIPINRDGDSFTQQELLNE